jgi:hypothetical protein
VRYLPLIWTGIWRNPGRTLLIFLQISVAFALFGVLQGMKTGVDQAIAKARADLLFVNPNRVLRLSVTCGLFGSHQVAAWCQIGPN